MHKDKTFSLGLLRPWRWKQQGPPKLSSYLPQYTPSHVKDSNHRTDRRKNKNKLSVVFLIASCVLLICQALAKLGLIGWIGRQTEAVVLAVNEESRLAVAILLVLWVSALASAFVDNIPLTTMMIRIVINLNQELDLPLQPLVWALAFGACLGG